MKGNPAQQHGNLQALSFERRPVVHEDHPGADPGRGESGWSHGQIFSTLEYFALTFLKILD